MRSRLLLVLALLVGSAHAQAPASTPASTEAPVPAESFAASYSRFAVAADHPAASAAGAEILAAGGNAADAAAATMLALGVASPASSGLGGGGFLLYYKASDRTFTFLDFREAAPAAATPDMFVDRPAPMPGRANAASQVGGLASGIPGEPAGIEAMVQRFGSGMPLSRIVQPAVKLAQDGVPVSGAVARMSSYFGDQMRADATMRRWFEGEGPLREGQLLRQPELARTLRELGARGARAIYTGRIAREIVRANRAAGGLFTMEDLAGYRVVEREPLRAERFGHTWVTAPPPSAGGFTLMQSLAVLESLPGRWRPTARGERPGAAFLHALAESWKGPYLDRERYFGDPDHVRLPLEAMLAPSRIAARAAAFHPGLANPPEDYDFPLQAAANTGPGEENGTSHLCVVDAEGNVAAVTTTVNLPFGARYTAAGIVMNDEMDDFAREVGVSNAFGLLGGAPNLPGPGKRPISTMSPTIVLDGEGRPVLAVGAAGGSRIVTATQQVAMNVVLFGMSGGDAMAAPRVHHQAHPNELRVESEHPLDAGVREGLVRRGHTIDETDHLATAQAIAIVHEENGVRLEAACDPRKGGRPAGR
ncbi:MAG: gamma-glutamyltransferase [Polyangiales bacterium]